MLVHLFCCHFTLLRVGVDDEEMVGGDRGLCVNLTYTCLFFPLLTVI